MISIPSTRASNSGAIPAASSTAAQLLLEDTTAVLMSCARSAHKHDRLFIGLDAVLQVLHEVLVLQVAQRVHVCVPPGSRVARQRNAARRKEGGRAVVARLAVDVAPVVGIDVKGDFACVCGPLLEELIEQPFPAAMHARRPGQHAVEVEQHGVVIEGRA